LLPIPKQTSKGVEVVDLTGSVFEHAPSLWARHLIVVVTLARLDDPKSYAGWSSGPW